MDTPANTTLNTEKLQILKLELKRLIVKAANLPQPPEQIGDQEPLFNSGLHLDSIDVLEIVVVLEKSYGLKIRNDEAGKKVLSNVESLATAILAQQKA